MANCVSGFNTGMGGYVLQQLVGGGATGPTSRLDVVQWNYDWDQNLEEVGTTASVCNSLYGINFPSDVNDCVSPAYNPQLWREYIAADNGAKGSLTALWSSNNNTGGKVGPANQQITRYLANTRYPYVPTNCPMLFVLNIGNGCPVPSGTSLATILAQNTYQSLVFYGYINNWGIGNIWNKRVEVNISFTQTSCLLYMPT